MRKLTSMTLVCLISICLFSSCDKFKDIIHPDDKEKKQDLSKYSNELILDWNLIALEAMGGPTYMLPLLNSRINAMVHIAMHDALNAIAQKYQTYAYQGYDKKAHPIAAAASAAHAVLIAHFPDQQTMLDEKLALYLAEIKDSKKKTAGIELGKAAAAAILYLRDGDGAFQDLIGTIEPSSEPGVFQPVPPFEIIYGKAWGDIQPLGLETPDQFRSEPYPALESQQYAEDFDEVKRMGQLDSPHRTADETFVAKFWYELSEMGWNKIARIVAEDQKLDLLTTARLFALLDIALADAYIASYEAKYHYNFWRPYAAIHAENDGNEQTVGDSGWEPSEITPPSPDYPSSHSTLGHTAATVLANIIGDETCFTFTSTTGVPADQSRTFTSFTQAADENADSRVWAGIHFRSACNAGKQMGIEVAEWLISNHLKPLK